MRKNNIANGNSIVNITLVDDYLNKREIRAKPPSQYMRDFKKRNSDLNKTIRTHLIDDLSEFGVWENNYDKFLEKRSGKIVRELRKRIEL